MPELDQETLAQKEAEVTASMLLAKRVELIKSGQYAEIEFPFKALTNITKALYPGTITLLCGDPGSCKSLFLLQCLNYWHNTGVPACIYALENDMEYHMMRVLAQREVQEGLTDLSWVEDNHEEVDEILERNTDFVDEFAQHIWVPDKAEFNMDTAGKWILERAKEGRRVICVDPVTVIPTDNAQSWRGEKQFIKHAEQVATEYGCSIIFVTHPTKALGGKPSMASLAGSADYSRFCHAIMWLEAHDTLNQNICGPDIAESMPHNRTMHILKVRNGPGQGVQDAFMFEVKGLLMKECGPVTKS